MKPLTLLLALAGLWAGLTARADDVKPLRVLLIAGGCCHDYEHQKDVLKKGLEERAHVVVDVVYSADRSTKARFDIFERADWAKGYDAVIHDECSADVKDMPYVQNILNAHKTVPAVNLHCAMHCYRTGTDDWFRFVGLQSTGHGPQRPIDVTYVAPDHPIAVGALENWTTINEELYNNVKLFDTARPLARGRQDTGKKVEDFIVAWTNQYESARVFSTTLGHNTDTVGDDRYLDLVTRGLLWSCDRLNDQYLKPAK